MSYSLRAVSGRNWFRPDTARKLSANLYSGKTPDDGQRNCPKHVEFYSRNKFEKLVHLVCFIARIHHDARSPERKISSVCRYVVEAEFNLLEPDFFFLILAHPVYKM